jgi:hypothetical protein
MTADIIRISLRCGIVKGVRFFLEQNRYEYFLPTEPWQPIYDLIDPMDPEMTLARLNMTEKADHSLNIGAVEIVLTGDGCDVTFYPGAQENRRKYHLLRDREVGQLRSRRLIIEPIDASPSALNTVESGIPIYDTVIMQARERAATNGLSATDDPKELTGSIEIAEWFLAFWYPRNRTLDDYAKLFTKVGKRTIETYLKDYRAIHGIPNLRDLDRLRKGQDAEDQR